jgi:adenylyltransferase/sulfurtransferase
VGREKVVSAAEKIKAINPDVAVQTYPERATAENARGMVKQYDFVIDGTDNFPAKFLINDACFFERVAFSHAGILRFDGQILTVLPGETACYRCVFETAPPAGAVPSCSQAGVLGSLAGVIGCLQATETLKFLLKLEGLLTNRLLIFDALRGSFREVGVKRNIRCPICGEKPSILELRTEEQPACDLKAK